MSWTWIAWGALAWGVGCAKDPKPQPVAKEAEPTVAPAEVAPAATQPAAEATAAALQPAAASAEVEIDPKRMPVEEDYVEQAAFRIGRSANLDLELKRIAAEIKAPPKK